MEVDDHDVVGDEHHGGRREDWLCHDRLRHDTTLFSTTYGKITYIRPPRVPGLIFDLFPFPGSGKIVRYCMQQLEEMGIMEVDEKTGGRRITPEGQREMDTVAFQTMNEEEADDDDE